MYGTSGAAAFGPPAEALKESSKRTKNRRYSLQAPAIVKDVWTQFRKKKSTSNMSMCSTMCSGSLSDLRQQGPDDEHIAGRRLTNSRDTYSFTGTPQMRSSQEELDRQFENFDTFLHWEPTPAASGSDPATTNAPLLQPMVRERSKSETRKYFGLRRRSGLGSSTGDLSFATTGIPPSLEQLPEGVQVHHATPVTVLKSRHNSSEDDQRIRSSSFSTRPDPLAWEDQSPMRHRSVSLSAYAAKDEKKNLKKATRKSSSSSFISFFVPASRNLNRTKSRSVDQSIAAAFDIDVIGGLSRLAGSALGTSAESDMEKGNDRKPHNSCVPAANNGSRVLQETMPYTVDSDDTLNNVAARFQTTPSELVSINKLGSRLILPGQVILVPRVDANASSEQLQVANDRQADQSLGNESPPTEHETVSKAEPSPTIEGPELEGAEEASAKKLLLTEASQESIQESTCEQTCSDAALELDDIDAERAKDREQVDKFLRLNVRHVTDGQGIVSGVLLVTPNTVIFDPNVSDPLVIEHGAEAYGVIIPMEMIANAAMFHDIARMRNIKEDNHNKNDVYFPVDCQLHRKYDTLSKKAELVKAESETNGSIPDLLTAESAQPAKTTPSNQATPDDILVQAEDSKAKQASPSSENPFSIPLIKTDQRPSPSEEDTSILILKDPFDSVLSEAKMNEATYRARHFSTGASSFNPNFKTKHSRTNQTPQEEPAETSSGTDNNEIKGKLLAEPTESTGQRMLKRLSYPLAWVGESFSSEGSTESAGGTPPVTSTTSQPSESMLSRVFSRRISMDSGNSSPRTLLRSGALAKYRNMVSVDVPEIFSSLDKLIPRPARSCEIAPLYLRLRIGRPLHKTIPQTTPVMSYGNNTIRTEYWFSIPKNKADDICRYFLLWSPGTYGNVSQAELESKYELVRSDDEETVNTRSFKMTQGQIKDESGTLGDLAKESWERAKAPYVRLFSMLRNTATLFESEQDEIVSLQNEFCKALSQLENEVLTPEQNGQSEILTDEQIQQLVTRLPARVAGSTWNLVFSTSHDGCSLNSLYRKLSDRDCPVLLVIKDTQANIFGAYAAAELRISDFFYGTGETFLFSFNPKLRVFNWTGENSYFVKGNPNSVAIGAGDGKFGIWLDGDLNQGRSQRCETFDNEPLNPDEDFFIRTVECWAFE